MLAPNAAPQRPHQCVVCSGLRQRSAVRGTGLRVLQETRRHLGGLWSPTSSRVSCSAAVVSEEFRCTGREREPPPTKTFCSFVIFCWRTKYCSVSLCKMFVSRVTLLFFVPLSRCLIRTSAAVPPWRLSAVEARATGRERRSPSGVGTGLEASDSERAHWGRLYTLKPAELILNRCVVF